MTSTALVGGTAEMFNWESAIRGMETLRQKWEAAMRPTRVLVVDDSENDVFLTFRLLSKYNCTASACRDASKAVEMISSGDFDLVLIDLMMPRLSGADVIKAVSAKTNKMARIVVLTGMPVNQTVDETLRLGAVWASKPLTDQILKTFLRSK